MSGRDAIFESPDNEFGAAGAQTLLDAAHASEVALVVADLGSAIDEGHRYLIEQADLVLGVVRPTTESLADAYRLAAMVRGLHMGRKLALVANQADDDREAGQIARDAGLDLVAVIPRDPAFNRRPPPANPRGAEARTPRDRYPLPESCGPSSSSPTATTATSGCSEGFRRRPPMSREPVPVMAVGPAISPATIGRIRQQLVARVPAEILDPFGRTAEDERVLRDAIKAILDDPELELSSTPALVAAVEAAVVGLGALQPLVSDPEVSDILVNGPDAAFVERRGRLESTDVRLGSSRELIERPSGSRPWPGATLGCLPIVDARMADGSRVTLSSLRSADRISRYASSTGSGSTCSRADGTDGTGSPKAAFRSRWRSRWQSSSVPERTSWSRARPAPARPRSCAR